MEEFNIEKEFEKLVENGWLNEEEAKKFSSDKQIINAINASISPKRENIFNALKSVSVKNLRVLILGQDPYPNPNHAHGYSFSSLDSNTPGSLQNIFKVIDSTYNSTLYENKKNDLTGWVVQGVLLLNTWLTFENKNMQSKHKKIWSEFTKTIIRKILSINNRPIALILWGNNAHDALFTNISDKNFKQYKHQEIPCIIPNTQIMVLQTGHPSPAGYNKKGLDRFFTSMPKYLTECDNHLGSSRIDWTKL